MGEECSTCKRCSDQEEIRAETSITTKPIVTKNANSLIKDKTHKTSQKSTNQTITSSHSNNMIQTPKKPIQQKDNKFKRKEGRKSTLDSIKFSSKKKSEFEEELRRSINSIHERKNSLGGSSAGSCSSFLSDGESSISISNKLFIDEINDSPSKKYEILSKLGSGSFGNVYLARNRYPTRLGLGFVSPAGSMGFATCSRLMGSAFCLSTTW